MSLKRLFLPDWPKESKLIWKNCKLTKERRKDGSEKDKLRILRMNRLMGPKYLNNKLLIRDAF